MLFLSCFSSGQIASATADEENYLDYPQSPKNVPESVSPAEDDISSSAAPDYKELKQEPVLTEQHSVVHASPNYNFGFGAPVVGSQIAPFENSESQARDASRFPGFVVRISPISVLFIGRLLHFAIVL